MILADSEHKRRHTKKVKRYRDLRDYKMKPVSEAMKHGRQIRDNDFTPERWAAFTRDIDFFIKRKKSREMTSNFYVDHGYNPPPTWTVVGSLLSNMASVDNIRWIAGVDIVLVMCMFVGVTWAFGADGLLFGMLFFVTTFSGRWPILGEALLRFDWLAAVVLSLCCMKKRYWLPAGALMAYAGFNRLFPMIFFFGWGLWFLRETYKGRETGKGKGK